MSSLWVSHHEDLLRKWAETCKTMALLHTRSSAYYGEWDRRLGIPLIVLGAAIASSIFITTNQPLGWLTYVNGLMSLVLTALTGVGRFLGLAELRVGHTAASNKYMAIAMKVDSALSFPRCERADGPQTMIDTTRRDLGEIREHAPAIAPWLLAESLSHFLKSPLTRIRSGVNSQPGDPSRSPAPSRSPRRHDVTPEAIVVEQTHTPDEDFGSQEAVALSRAMRSDSDGEAS